MTSKHYIISLTLQIASSIVVMNYIQTYQVHTSNNKHQAQLDWSFQIWNKDMYDVRDNTNKKF